MPDAHDMLFRTLADPTRRALFERLCREGEQTVGSKLKDARHLHIHEDEPFDEALFIRWVKQARRLPGEKM